MLHPPLKFQIYKIEELWYVRLPLTYCKPISFRTFENARYYVYQLLYLWGHRR